MSAKCQHCQEATETSWIVDVPDGTVLCDRCHDDFIWTCDSCGREIALPTIEGGQFEGEQPLMFEHWCLQCCDEKTSVCTACGEKDLTCDMQASDKSLICERCADQSDFLRDDDSPLLTKDNWENVVVGAIEALPAEFQESVGHSKLYDGSIMIKVAVEGIDDDDEEEVWVLDIEVRYYNSMRERGWPAEFDAAYGPGGILEEQVEWPLISVETEERERCEGVLVERASINVLIREIQLAVLEVMYSGGINSMVARDEKGRFVRDDGTRILGWQ